MLREHAGNHIRLASRSERHDDLDDAIGVVLRGREIGDAQNDDGESRGYAMSKLHEVCHGPHPSATLPQERRPFALKLRGGVGNFCKSFRALWKTCGSGPKCAII